MLLPCPALLGPLYDNMRHILSSVVEFKLTMFNLPFISNQGT